MSQDSSKKQTPMLSEEERLMQLNRLAQKVTELHQAKPPAVSPDLTAQTQKLQPHPLMQKTDGILKQTGRVHSAPLHIEEELQKLRQDFDKYRADEATKYAADKEQHMRERKIDHLFMILGGAIAGAIGSSIANLFIFYWPSILAFFKH